MKGDIVLGVDHGEEHGTAMAYEEPISARYYLTLIGWLETREREPSVYDVLSELREGRPQLRVPPGDVRRLQD